MSVKNTPGFFVLVLIFVVAAVCLFTGNAIAEVPLVPLVVVASLFFFFCAFTFSDLAIILLIIAMLLSPEFALGAISKQRSIVIRIDDLLIVILIFAWLARSALYKNLRFIAKTPLNRTIALYCIAFILPTVKSMITGEVSPVKGSFYMFKYLEYFAVFYLICGVLKDRSQVMLYMKFFLIVFAIVNIYAFTQIGHTERVSAPFEGKEGEPNTLGGYQVLVLGVLIGILTHTKLRTWKWPLVALAVFTLVPFAYTLSRASYMAIIPMYMTLIFFNKFSSRTILIGTLMVSIILLIFFFPQNVKDRIVDAFTPDVQDEYVPPAEIMGIKFGPSASARIWDWIDVIGSWKKRPFMGYGVTGANFLDSQYVLVLIESGLIGLVSFFLLLGNVFISSLKYYKLAKDDLLKGIALGFLAGHVGMVFHAITANTFIVLRIMEPYWFLAAIVMMIPKLDPALSKIKTKEPNRDESYVRNSEFLLKTNGS